MSRIPIELAISNVIKSLLSTEYVIFGLHPEDLLTHTLLETRSSICKHCCTAQRAVSCGCLISISSHSFHLIDYVVHSKWCPPEEHLKVLPLARPYPLTLPNPKHREEMYAMLYRGDGIMQMDFSRPCSNL